MADIFFDISTRANLSGFTELTEAEREQLIRIKQLEERTRQAEAVTAHYGATAAAAYEKVSRGAMQADAAQRRLNDTYARQMTLRHGPDLTLTPQTRQMLRQLEQQAPTVYSEYTRNMVTGADEVSGRRVALAQVLRDRHRQRIAADVAEKAALANTAAHAMGLPKESIDQLRALSIADNANILKALGQEQGRQLIATMASSRGTHSVLQGMKGGSLGADYHAWQMELRTELEAMSLHASAEIDRAVKATVLQHREQIKAADEVFRNFNGGYVRDRRFYHERLTRTHGSSHTMTDAETAIIAGGRPPSDLVDDVARYDRLLGKRGMIDEEIGRQSSLDDFGVRMLGSGIGAGRNPHLRQARRIVGRSLAKYPDVRASITEEEFEKRAGDIAGQLASKETAVMGMLGMGAAAAAGVGAAVYSVAEKDRGLSTAAAERIVAGAPSRRTLRQIAGSAGELKQLQGASEGLQGKLGMDPTTADAAIFALKSANEFNPEGQRVVSAAYNMGAAPDAVISAIQKGKANFGTAAGTSGELFSKLIIAAGPSPARIDDLSTGVGVSAQSWRAIGGDADDLLAALSTGAIGGKGSETAATNINSLAHQLSRKSSRILWGDRQPLRGMPLVMGLQGLADENRLLDSSGKPQSVKAYLEESRAISGYDQILNQKSAVLGLAAQLRDPANRDRGERQAGFGDLSSDATRAAEAAKNALLTTQNKKTGVSTELVTGMIAAMDKNALDSGSDGPWSRTARGIAESYQTTTMFGGGGYDGAADDMVAAGRWGSKDLLAQYFRNKLQDSTLTKLQGELTNKSPQLTATWRSLSWRDMPGMSDFSPLSDADATAGKRTMTDVEQKVYRQTLQGIIADRTGKAAAGLEGGGGNDENLTDWEKLEKSFMPARGYADWNRVEANTDRGFAGMLADFRTSTGYSDSDYRSKIMEGVVAKHREAAVTAYEGTIKAGKGADAAQRAALAQADPKVINAEYDEGTYQDNVRFMTTSIAAAEADVNSATTPADKAGKRKRLMALKGLRQATLADDGVTDYQEAQGFRDQVDPTHSDKLLTAVTGIAGTLQELAGKLGTPGALTDGQGPPNLKPGVEKRALKLSNQAGPPAPQRGGRTAF